MRKHALVAYGGILLSSLLGPAATADAEEETSATARERHVECDGDLWRHLERRARDDADRFCSERGGVDDENVRWIHHDSEYGVERICVVHLHYGCQDEKRADRIAVVLPGRSQVVDGS